MRLGSAWRCVGGPKDALRRLRSLEASRGFTLVELMIVVAMIGVLAALAIVGYRKYLTSAQASEAKAVIQGIRGQEEAYKAETLTYLATAGSLTDYYPRAKAALDEHKAAWDNPGHAKYAQWKTLNVVTDGPVRFGYAVFAGLPGDVVPPASEFASPPTWPNPTTDPWYVVQAAGDRNNNKVYALFLSSSFSGEIYSENDFE